MRLLLPMLVLLVGLAAAPAAAQSCDAPAAVCPRETESGAAIIAGGVPAPIVGDAAGDEGIRLALQDLQSDLGRVAGTPAALLASLPAAAESVLIVGSLDSPLIRSLAEQGKIDTSGVAGGWEAYLHQLVEDPAPGVKRALVIAGADKRGTIFGIYDLSQAIGVSPWHWWADVPVARRTELYVTPGRRIEKPRVKYRGIFINDEEPALGNWTRQTFGGFNHQFYAKVFELILRSRGNYLWPAMWGKAIYDDDPRSAELADAMGVVIGTSHHEPLMRAHVEWERHGEGPWDYTKNAERLRAFWREGIARMGDNESLVTIGMRGDGDEPMTEGTAIELLETIVADQRKIIAEVTGRPASETPQVWALYKEVQDYYDKGMTVPDDVTLLFADDNWGNIRRLPKPGAQRPGGYGVYYHFDYVGGPRNYKWINTNQIERVWEQMHLAYEHGADRLWIVNVGDIKPMEFPTSFFLDYAWDPEAWPLERLADYPRIWAERQFGPAHAADIGALLTRYAQYASRRKPELLGPETYSLDHFGEAARVLAEWQALLGKAQAVEQALPPEQRDAYFQLVLHPILANANLHELYVTVARNRALAAKGDPAANALAEHAKRLYQRHGDIRRRYEEEIAGGKWAHMMSQAVIGYTNWQQPDAEVMPEVLTVEAQRPARADAQAQTDPPKLSDRSVPAGSGFLETDGFVAVEAEHFARAVVAPGFEWRIIPNLGRTLSGVTIFPVTAPEQVPGGDSTRLEYRVHLLSAGEIEAQVVLSPTLDYKGQSGLRYAISIDDAPPQIVNVHADPSERAWERAVANNAWISTSRHRVAAPGPHVVKLWLVDPGLVFQRFTLSAKPLPPSYLGPPESPRL